MKHKVSAALAAAAGAGVLTGELYKYVFRRDSSALFEYFHRPGGHGEAFRAFREASAARLRALPHTDYTIHSARGEALRGYYFPAGTAHNRIAFVIHGYRSNAMETAGMVQPYYHSRGVDVFCCDLTASGESGGDEIGFDVLETQDCLRWVAFLRQQFGPEVQILLHGFSMGAATVLQMSSHCPANVKAIVSDSAYQNARASLWHQIGPLYTPLRYINRAVAGYDWNDSDVLDSLSHSTLPILFVHGQDDKLVPFANGPTLYNFYQGEKDCLFPTGTRHIESMFTASEEYAAKLDALLEKYFIP